MAEPFDFDTALRAALEGSYVLERELLGGGMSRVFLATEQALNRKVVIKVLPPELAAGVNRERFRREIQLAAQLQHPHIVPLYSAGEHGELLFYTMPFIEGESLKHALQTGARFSPRDVLRILHDVVDALAYAHARGVIHRDIKPGNVLRSGVHAVVTDFGVAKAIKASMPAVGMTTSGMAIGTPAYMAPEQLAGDPAADHRVDLYAVGLLAYELLTGAAPFSGASPQATMAAQLTQAPARIDAKRRDVPPALVSLIDRCLAKDPNDRWQSATEMLAALDVIVLPSGDYPPLSVGRGRGRSIWIAAAVLLAAAGITITLRAPRESAQAPLAATDGPKVIDVPPVAPGAGRALITREDSFAIAAQIAGRSAQRAKTPAAQQQTSPADIARMVDSLFRERETRLLDSLQRSARQITDADPMRAIRNMRVIIPPESLRYWAEQGAGATRMADSTMRLFVGRGARGDARSRGTGPAARRRLVITELSADPTHKDWGVAQHAVADTLRKFLSASRPFRVVPADTVQWALAKSRYAEDVGPMLHAELFASVGVRPAGKDSVSFVVILRDLGSVQRVRTATMPAVPASQPLNGIERLLASVFGELSDLSRSPRATSDAARVAPGPMAAPAQAPATPATPAIPAPPPVKRP